MQPYTFATPGGSSSCPAPPNTAPVHFSLFYRLHHTTCSLTACHSTSPTRLSGPSHQSSSPSATVAALARQEEGEGRSGYVTPHRSSALIAPTGLSHHHHHNQRVPPSSPSYAVSPPAQAPSPPPQRATSSSAALSPPSSSPPPLLSTMDRRELSKVIVRDAVYARVLDLVPGREQVQVAVWTLSPHVVQIDGAVAVCALPRDATAHTTAASYSITATSGFAYPSTRASTLATTHASDARRVLQARLSEVAVDANLFASLLKPYLGEVGCHGDVVYAAVDGVSVMT